MKDASGTNVGAMPPIEPVTSTLASTPRGIQTLRGSSDTQPTGLDRCLYRRTWNRTELPAAASLESASWLIFMDPAGLGRQISEQLKGAEHQVVEVSPGKTFARVGKGKYRVRPGHRADYDALIVDITKRTSPPQKVVHLWSAFGRSSPASPDETIALSFSSLVYLAQALGEQDLSGVDLAVVSNSLQSVSGEPVTQPVRAISLGAARALPKAFPEMTCRSIDCDPEGQGISYVAVQVIAEHCAPFRDAVVAYRGDERWVETVEHAELRGEAKHGGLKHDGTYLITGGLGDLGLAIAENLARNFHARLVLVDDTPLPAVGEWPNLLQNRTTPERIKQAIRKLIELQTLGSEVMSAGADAARPDEMNRAVEAARQRFGNVDGVIHATGTLKDAQGFASTIKATLALEGALQGSSVDFLVLLSCADSSPLTERDVEHQAATAFLEAFANSRPDASVVSINLGPQPEATSQQSSLISQGEGASAVVRILSADAPRVVLASKDDLRTAVNTASPAINPAPGGEENVEAVLTDWWQELLNVDEVGLDDDFFELGGHSLIGVQLFSKIKKTYGVSLGLATLFEARTIRQLAQLIRPASTSTSVETVLTGWWQELLSVEEVGPDDDFFELGGHSLIGVQLFSKIKKTYGVSLGLATLFEARTVRQLAQLIQPAYASAATLHTEPRPWSPLVPIQPTGTRPPLFVISGLGGNVIKFHNLAFHLGEDQPVYGLLPRGLDGKDSFHTRIEDMAADYVAAIRKMQPEGPYQLVGYSFGGIVAFEVAQQIVAQGEQVGLLGLFDTIEWHYGERVDRSLRPGERFHVLQEHLRTIVFSAERGYHVKKLLNDKASAIKYRVFRALGRPLPQKMGVTEEVNAYAATGYYPNVYPGKVTLFRSTKRTIQQGSDDFLGWEELAGGGVEVHDVPGTHFNILQEPVVQVLAEKLQACLDLQPTRP
jgi:thioesterase domain-containing protein/acyl carrier protein/NAD(P)-dependent dehydrogenase (short-subunit alcohol dehydrogenase family)